MEHDRGIYFEKYSMIMEKIGVQRVVLLISIVLLTGLIYFGTTKFENEANWQFCFLVILLQIWKY